MPDEDWMKNFIKRRAKETWDSLHSPYHISNVAIEMKKEGVDYRAIIAPLKLRQWVEAASIPETKTLIDEFHRAHVGFIPESENFDFGSRQRALVGKTESSTTNVGQSSSRGRRPVVYFLQSLGRLSDEELNEIHIPIRTIVKLLNE